MKSDINFPKVEGISVAISREQTGEEEYHWKVHLINNNDFPINNVMVNSKGYGNKDGEKVETSVLRHMFEVVEANGTVVIETIDPEVFKLTNQYWVSYYLGREIYDKKFIFVPGSIVEAHLSFLPQLGMEAVLHN